MFTHYSESFIHKEVEKKWLRIESKAWKIRANFIWITDHRLCIHFLISSLCKYAPVEMQCSLSTHLSNLMLLECSAAKLGHVFLHILKLLLWFIIGIFILLFCWNRLPEQLTNISEKTVCAHSKREVTQKERGANEKQYMHLMEHSFP